MASETQESKGDELAFEIGGRLRLFRESLGASQEKFASMIGGTKRAIQNNESGKTAPNSKLLHGLVALGLNINWLLSGEGPMLLVGLAEGWRPDLLYFAAEMVDEELERRKLGRENPQYAELVALVYGFCHKTGNRDRDMVRALFATGQSVVHLLESGPSSDRSGKVAPQQEDRDNYGQSRIHQNR